MGRFPVAPCAARFLVIGLDMLREVGMDHEPDVRFVDAHAEGDGRHDHRDLVPVKGLLVLLPFFRGQARVVGERLNAAGREERAPLL